MTRVAFFIVVLSACGGGGHSLSGVADDTKETICHVCDVIDRVCEADAGTSSP